MAHRFGLIACDGFEAEIRAVQGSPEFDSVLFHVHQADCDLSESTWKRLKEAVASCRGDGCLAGVVGGSCLTRPAKEIGLDGTCRLFRKSPCAEWVAGKDALDALLHEGALPVLPGWLRNWDRHVEARWGQDRKAAQSFFRDVARKVVLLDTGAYPGVERDLKTFGRFLRLPCEVHPVGLEHFRMALAEVALAWRLELLGTEADERVALIGRRLSDYARVGQLLGVVTSAKTMEGAETGVLEIFRALLGPREARFHSVDSLSGRAFPEGSPWDRILTLNAEHAWTDDRASLCLKVAQGRELLGVLELEGVDGLSRDEQGLDLALALARISGLALANVRMSRALEAARERAAGAEAALASDDEKLSRIFNYPLGIYRTTPHGKILDASPTLARMLGYSDVQSLKAVGFWDLHNDPRDRDHKRAFLDASSMVGIFESQLRRADGTCFWAEDSCRAAKDAQGKVLFYDGVIEDITARKRMTDEHAWVVHLQAAVGEVSERLLSPTPIQEMSALVMDQARRLTSSATAFVGHIDRQTGGLVPSAMTADARAMLDEHPPGDASLHGRSGIWRWVLDKKRPIVTALPGLDPRYTGMPPWHLPVAHFLAVPAIMEGTIVGLIVVANADNPYVERDLKAVERLADLYAIAVQRTRTEDALREMSLVDELTRAYNRRGFMTLAEQQIKVAHRTKKDMSLFFADLDDLKAINDTFGHEEGDVALVEAAALLRDVFRDSDIIARIGGDEFAVLAIDVVEGKAAALARRLREKLQARNARAETAYALSFSLGVVRYDPDKPCSLQELLTRADRKMYQDKTSKKSAPAVA
ncbi:MAG TPA: diguanylate cyclase [Candidatus Aminicenantes bacterium]|nr:diguanylate cyclase [Candidatus Aminicenantes bacterium]